MQNSIPPPSATQRAYIKLLRQCLTDASVASINPNPQKVEHQIQMATPRAPVEAPQSIKEEHSLANDLMTKMNQAISKQNENEFFDLMDDVNALLETIPSGERLNTLDLCLNKLSASDRALFVPLRQETKALLEPREVNPINQAVNPSAPVATNRASLTEQDLIDYFSKLASCDNNRDRSTLRKAMAERLAQADNSALLEEIKGIKENADEVIEFPQWLDKWSVANNEALVSSLISSTQLVSRADKVENSDDWLLRQAKFLKVEVEELKSVFPDALSLNEFELLFPSVEQLMGSSPPVTEQNQVYSMGNIEPFEQHVAIDKENAITRPRSKDSASPPHFMPDAQATIVHQCLKQFAEACKAIYSAVNNAFKQVTQAISAKSSGSDTKEEHKAPNDGPSIKK